MTAASVPLRAPAKHASSGVLRLGVVSYLNARPLVHGLEAEPGVSLEPGVPSQVARRLHEGMLEWCGGSFNSEFFDIDATNANLKRIRL